MKNIDIKEPCSEDFSQMTPTQRGAFCNKCAMDVYDFTNKSGDEIRDILRLKVGSRVCGRVKSSQLDELNADFDAWRITNKHSFQRVLVFSMIFAFGMTLFSCEEEEIPVIGAIQTAGRNVLASFESTSSEAGTYFLDKQEITSKKIEFKMAEIKEMEEIHYVSEYLGAIEYERYDSPDIVLSGDISSTVECQAYLIERVPTVVEEEKIEFEAFTFPNPAKEQTTLKVRMPEEMQTQINLFSMNGQWIREINSLNLDKGETDFPVDLIDLAPGTYIITIVSKSYKESVKFIKM